MQIEKFNAAAELLNEQALSDRLQRLHKRDDKPPVAKIAVENAAGEVRIVITCHTESEEAGVERLLDDRYFNNRLETHFEEEDEEGNIEGGFDVHPHDEYSAIYVEPKPLAKDLKG